MDDYVIFGCSDAQVYALDAASGEVVWQSNSVNFERTAPVLSADGSRVYAGEQHGVEDKTSAIDARNGTVVWQFGRGGSVAAGVGIDRVASTCSVS